MNAPFVVFALPRSRTAWLAKFLSYKDWHCGHEEIRHFRVLEDVKAWLSQPNTGSVETCAPPYWRLLQRYAPEAKVVTVRRPVADVVDSLMRLELYGTGKFERNALTLQMERLNAKLNQIEARIPNVLSVTFEQLNAREEARRLFEHLLPHRLEGSWWHHWRNRNVTEEIAPFVRHARAFADRINNLSEMAKQSILAEFSLRGISSADGIEFREESFDEWYSDSLNLLREQAVKVGQHPEVHTEKNLPLMKAHNEAGSLQIVTARANGRMFGYQMSLISPSMESPSETWGINTTGYASPAFPGLGYKLHRAAAKALRAKGVDKNFMRTSLVGDGPRMGTLYKRLGATPSGQFWCLNLCDA